MHYEKFADGSVKCIEDEIPFELPEGWAWARLGSVFLTVTGSTPSTKDFSLYGTDYPFYKPTDLDAGYKVFKSESTVSEKGYRSGRPLPPHSILVTCIGATIGKTGYIHNAGICNQQINAILPNTDILSDYTYFCICSQFEQQQILMNSSATTLPILNKGKFDNLLFPVPPHEQQLLIVDKIQNLLTLVNKIQDNQGFLKDKIITTKAKILDLAISGKLVPQDPDDEPASVLLERIRAEKEDLIKQGKIKRDKKESVIFKGEDNSYYGIHLPDSWNWASLREIALSISDGSHNPPLNNGSGIPLLSAANINDNSILTNEISRWITNEEWEIENQRTNIEIGDVLLTIVGSIGRSAVVQNNYHFALQRSVAVIKPCLINPLYLMYIVQSPQIQKWLTDNSKGTAQKGIYLNALSLMIIPIPPLAEQARIVEHIHIAYKQLDLILNALL